METIELLYGDGTLPVEIGGGNVLVVRPPAAAPLADPAAACREAFARPIGSPPLGDLLRGARKVAAIIPDGTRPLPFEPMLRWLFEATDAAGCEATVVVGTGSHRPNTPGELRRMMGEEIVSSRRIVNHSAFDRETLAPAGRGPDGHPVFMNREAMEADRRIALGFIEPHFMAGFSGGYKAVMPGIADIETILHYHRAQIVGDPRSTWGELEGNPTQEIVRRYGALCPVDFLFNITMTAEKAITGIFCGDPILAHEAGCRHIKSEAMVPVPRAYPIVVTCNNGFPLDQNLYQAVKGMSAAAMIVEEGGLILQASECRDGFPEHGNFKKLLFDHPDAGSLLRTINSPGFSRFDQWEAQILANIRTRARIGLRSALPPEEVRRAYLDPVGSISEAIAAERGRIGRDAPVAVLPAGFAAVPFLGGR